MQTLKEFQKTWVNTEQHTRYIHESFCELVNNDPKLKAHRDFVESHGYGFGERSFHWMWKLILDSIDNDVPNLLEIGVYKGQVLSLWQILKSQAMITGITPLSTDGGMADRDYFQDIKDLHIAFNLPYMPVIVKTRSDDINTLKEVTKLKNIGIDILYIDGGHSYKEACFDIIFYSPLVRKGGYLVIDDCACDILHPFGYFMGIEDVCKAVQDTLLDSPKWEFVGSVVHNKIWRRI